MPKSTPLLATSGVLIAAIVNMRDRPLASSCAVNRSPMPTTSRGGPPPDARNDDSTIARSGDASTARYAAASLGVAAVVVELGGAVVDEPGVEPGRGPLAGLGETGRGDDLHVLGRERRDRAHVGLARDRVERDRVARVRLHDDVETARRVARELADLADEHRREHRDEHEDEHDQREHPERHRRPEPSRQRVGQPEPDGQRSLRDPPDPVPDRLLVLRGEHDRGADEDEALHDEHQHVDARGRVRSRRGPRATAHARTIAPIAVLTAAARERCGRASARCRRTRRPGRASARGTTSPRRRPPVSSEPDARARRRRGSSIGGAACGSAGSVMSRIAWMMLKRLSQMLATTTVVIAITNPTTSPRSHARPLEREVQRDAGVVAAAREQLRRRGHQARDPSPSPTNVPAIAESTA